MSSFKYVLPAGVLLFAAAQTAGMLHAQQRERVAAPTGAATQPRLSAGAVADVPYVIPAAVANRRSAPQAMTQGPTYDLPLRGDDLVAGERYYVGKKIHSESGSQKWGYDIGAMRHTGNGAWSEVKSTTDWKNPKNSDYYVYGKPVYAMGPGKVIRCWRNAPENPRPYSSAMGDSFDQAFADRKWLHQAWRDEKMSGAGNHLLVEEDDGDLVLYAHAQPGSIPSKLCPHNGTLYSKPKADSEGDVPAAQQATIKAGDLLYKMGNSGNSSAPHLHVHLQTAGGDPIQMRFRRGLAASLSGGKADINKWTRFAGQRIPDGPVLVWPPRRLGGEYARHGYPAGDFQRLFDHLADSGFWPEWIDGYSVGGKPYLNFVWRPAKGAWRAHFLLTPQDYQARFNQATADKYAPVHVESSLVGGQPRYTAIFVKDKPGGALARHGLTTAQHDAVMQEAKSKNLSPVNISVVSVGGQRSYTVLYRSESIGGWEMKSQIPAAQYQALYDQNKAAGRYPVYVNAYMHGGSPFYSVVFSQKPGGKRKDRHGLSAAQYQSEFTSALQGGLFTRAVSGYDGGSDHRYIAAWRE